jgi:hypothetical protein
MFANNRKLKTLMPPSSWCRQPDGSEDFLDKIGRAQRKLMSVSLAWFFGCRLINWPEILVEIEEEMLDNAEEEEEEVVVVVDVD